MKQPLVVLGTAGFIVLMVWLLKPVPKSDRWDIDVDGNALETKQLFLKTLREQNSNAAATAAGKPNVIFLLADDLGKYDVSLYRRAVQPVPASYAEKIETPNIDALGKNGVVYRNAYVTAPICGPSRAGLMTGRYQNRFGFESQPMQRYVRNNLEYLWFRYVIDTNDMTPIRYENYPRAEMLPLQGLPVSEITLADVFKATGYSTGIFGKWHLGYGPMNHPNRFGFDQQYGFIEAFSLYAPEGDNNIMSYHHTTFSEKHIWSQQRSGPSAITRNGEVVDEKRYLTDAIVDETKQFIHRAAETKQPFFAYVAFNAVHTPFQARKPDYDSITNVSDDKTRVYQAMTKRLDWAVGELVRYLQEQGLAENTLIIFASDNGGASYTAAMDNAPLRGGKLSQYEGGLQVPFMIAWPGKLAARDVEQPVILTDIFATLASQLGVSLPTDRVYDGTNLLAKGVEQTLADRPLFWRSDYNHAIRFHQWKLIRNDHDHTVKLFDLAQDPGERHNLTADKPEIVRDLTERLDAWEKQLQPAKWPRVMDFRMQSEGETDTFAI